MGGGAILAFIKAIFVGAGAGASAGYILAVNVARIAILTIIAKATAPKLDLSAIARAKTITIRDPIAPQTFTYGEDLVSGPLIFGNVAGNENRDLYLAVAFAGHEIDSVLGYRIDDTNIALSELSGAEDGDVTGGKYSGVARVDVRLGTSTQVAVPNLTTTFPTLFNSVHQGRGWSYMVWEFNLIEGSEDAFKTQPTNLRVHYRGYKVYDPRLDSTNGGVGLHRLADPTTWEWSHNPALCTAHFLLDDRFGMKEEDDRIDWPKVITAADICEELVAIPTAATQERYTCNVTFSADQTRREVRDELVNSMLGRMVFSQGLWMMWAGAALTSDVNLDEANLLGSITLQATTGSRERYNRVRGKFIDLDRDWMASTYPEARSSTYVTEDGGEVRPSVVDFMSTNNFFEAQRKSIITLDMSRNQRVVVFEGNMSVFRIQAGSVVTLDIAEWGFAGEKFFVTEWKFTDIGVNLTLVEEVDTVWDEPAEGQYTTRSATGVLTFGETGVPAPTSLVVTTLFNGAALSWTNPLVNTFREIEIWAADENVRGSAILIGTTAGESFLDVGFDAQRTRYYWVRAVNRFGEFSDWEPNLTTTTFIAYPLLGERPMVADPFIRSGSSYWDVSDAETSYSAGTGLDGTDTIRLAPTSSGAGFLTEPRRGPREWDVMSSGTMSIEIRWRVQLVSDPGPSWSQSMLAQVRVEDEDETNGVTTSLGGSISFQDGDATGVWFDDMAIIEIVDTGAPPRFIQVGLQTANNLLGPVFAIDFIDAKILGRKFGGSGVPGLVPDPGTTAGKFLGDDGTWQTVSSFSGLGIWRHRTETATPPSSGQIRFNNATPTSATLFYVHETNDGGADMANFLALIDDGAIVYLQDVDNADNFFTIEISSYVDSGSYVTFGIQSIVLQGVEPAQNQEMAFIASTAAGAGGGGGDVTKVGIPVNNELAVWTGDGTIEGDTNLTWDGLELTVTGDVTGNNLAIADWDTAFGWGDHAGLYEVIDGTILRDDDTPVTITGAWEFTNAGGIVISATGKGILYLEDPDSGADATVWGVESNDGVFSIAAYNDARSASTTAMSIQRSGQDPTGVFFFDPVSTSSTLSALGGSSTDWNTAYSWGDHAGLYAPIAGYNNSNWDTAFTWGDHASAGYAVDSGLVHTTGAESIAGVKTFTDDLKTSTADIEVHNSGGGEVRIYDNANVDWAILSQIGQNFRITTSDPIGNIELAPGGNVRFTDGGLDIDNASGNPALSIDRDLNDINFVFANATVDWNISGLTGRIQAGTVDVDFDAITATSYGTVAEANLLDKAATEVIDGQWTFQHASFGQLIVDRISATGGAAIRYQNNDGVKGYAGFNDAQQFELYNSSAASSGFNVSGTGQITANKLYLNESTGADGDVAGDGQIWVKNNAPNDLYYTADNGVDYPLAYATYRRQSQTVLDHLNQTLDMTTDSVADALVNGLWAKTTTTARTLTLEPSTDTQFQVGAQIAIYNRGSSGDMTITEGTGTTLLVLDGSSTTDAAGSATIGPGGYATLIRESTTIYTLMGAGITP